MKISTFVIGIMVVTMFSVLFTFLYVDVGDAYGVVYDNETFVDFDKREELQEVTNSINASLQNIAAVNSEDTNIIQKGAAFINGLVGGGWAVIQASLSSVNIFADLVSTSLNSIDFGGSTNIIKIGLLVIGFLAFAFAVVSALVGKDV